ncbi:hypothetical protein ABB10_07775 [Bacillus thuringiensis]|uniref:Uncharacterized protein n=1 Tax=Bacillus thuringiensis DB27 TaxID=1431339 RepID=W8YDN0_BACTU|nr:hypothetical protein [Bacillus thuringiensis]MBG9669510.1 hypothetical protein [Bacillus thuringiensis]MBH0352140.1 hypothetical protein [Bacillus thuringiensis]CDN39649.1 unnamed protein product [Bacillus thuringiensis DB27]
MHKCIIWKIKRNQKTVIPGFSDLADNEKVNERQEILKQMKESNMITFMNHFKIMNIFMIILLNSFQNRSC